MKLPTYLASAIIAVNTGIAFAEQSTLEEEVVVTATRTPVPLTKTLAPVTVVSAEDIETNLPTDLYDTFKQIPSLNIRRNGGPGATTSVFLRGTNSGQTLILVDGVRINSATTGNTALEYLDPDQIERIEIVRGARASLYGADAIGGVIQIFTKRAEAGFHPQFKIAGGTDAYQEYQLALEGGTEAIRYRIAGNHVETDGFDRRNDGDEDAYRKSTASAFFSWDIIDQLSTEVSYQFNQGESEFDPGFGQSMPFTDFEVESLSSKTTFKPVESLTLTAILARSVDFADSLNDTPNNDGFGSLETTRNTYSLQGDYQLGDSHVFTLGGEYYDEDVSGTGSLPASPTAITERENSAFFGQYQLTLDKLSVIAGWRQDDNDAFDKASTRSFSVGYAVTDNLSALYSYSTGFRAPTFNDLFFPGFGNPDLFAEDSENNELTLKANWQPVALELSVYRTTFDNLIETAVVPPSPAAPFGFAPLNVGEARINGVDLVASTELAGFLVSGSFTWLDAVDQTNAIEEPLRRRADRQFKLDVDKTLGAFNVGFSLNAQSEAPDGSQVISGFGVVDLRMGYQVTKELKLGLKVGNLFDKSYQTIAGFDEDRVNAVFSATYKL